MLRILIIFFTLNALLLPASGYANVSVPDDSATPITMADSGIKCKMPMAKACPNCDMENMDGMDCGTNCCTHCAASHVVSLPVFFGSNFLPVHNGEIVTTFKHFYLHTTSPEQRPPLV